MDHDSDEEKKKMFLRTMLGHWRKRKQESTSKTANENPVVAEPEEKPVIEE